VSATERPYLSIIIPAYNEERRLPPSLRAILDYLRAQSYTWEVVVVDDGSRDATGQLAAEILDGAPHMLLRNEPNRGKALSVKRGLAESRGQVALFSDADLSTPIEETASLLEAIAEGADVAIGSRQMRESDLAVRQPLHRELAGRAFSLLNRMIVGHGIVDSQCGFKAFTRDAVERILPHQQLSGWAFDAELMLIARRLGLNIAQVPVRWLNDPDSRVKMLVDGPRMVADLFRIRRLHRHLRADSLPANH
jgi:dolichyl-phosphate beta-glucosyltransferase